MRKMVRKKVRRPAPKRRVKKVPGEDVKVAKVRKPKVYDRIPEDIRDIMIQNGVNIQRQALPPGKKPKYSGARNVKIHEDCDLLQRLIIVRPYIQKKYDINIFVLEILLYFYPIPYFNGEIYSRIPKQRNLRRMMNLVEAGHFSYFSKAKTISRSIFCLSPASRKIVKEFYEYLSGEKALPLSTTQNPIAMRRMRLIEDLQNMPVPDSKKKLYD